VASFIKYGEFLDHLPICFSRRTLLHGVGSFDISISKLTGYGLDSRDSVPGRGRDFHFSTSRPVLGPTHPPIHMVMGSRSLHIKRPER